MQNKKSLIIAQTDVFDPSNGVWNKVYSEYCAIKKIFGYCDLAGYENNDLILIDNDENKSIITNKYHVHRRLHFWLSLNKYLRSHSYEFVYIRFPIIDQFVINVLKTIKKQNAVTIVEIPTYPLEIQHSKGKLKFLFLLDKHYHKKLPKYVDKILYIGESNKKIFGCPSFQIPNGFDKKLSNQTITGFRMSQDNRVKMVGVSTLMPWHGYERILRGMVNYYRSDPKVIVDFVIIGDGPCKNEYSEIVKNGNIEKYVSFTGKLSGTALEDYFKEATIGVGSFGMYKNFMNEGSTLKIKEYLMRGLPFVYGCPEIGIPSDYKYSLLFQNDSSDIDINAIVDFVLKYINDGADAEKEMREFAEETFSWENILRPFLESDEVKE